MRIQDCISSMSKFYLGRIIDSFIKESIPRGDEDRLRQQILESTDELADHKRIKDSLALAGISRSMRILIKEILHSLLESNNRYASEQEIIEYVRNYEQNLVEKSKSDDVFDFSDEEALSIYLTVLEVALEDDVVSQDEFALLEKLRSKLKLSRLEHRLLEARLGMFPRKGNELHTADDISNGLKELQHRGLLFYCNKADEGPIIVLPDEIAPGVKEALGFEMREEAQRLLHKVLKSSQLSSALESLGLTKSGSKADKSDRLISAGCKPSEILNALRSSELGEICAKLEGVTKSGTFEERKDRIIDYYASLTFKEREDSEDPRAIYYQYLEEFAARDNKNLYERELIKRDRDMESGFEEGTRYLFEKKLGCQLLEFDGSDHADGGVEFKNGDILLWDNKGKESEYTFPQSHLRQFKRYIRNSVNRVGVFLVIVPEIGNGCKTQAARLKYESNTDSDVAIISATDLKYVAENWRKFSGQDEFDIEVFNITGILDRQLLDERMKIVLK